MQHSRTSASTAAARELRRYGSLRVEKMRTHLGYWISPAWDCWTELFEVGGRVHDENRRAGTANDPRTFGPPEGATTYDVGTIEEVSR